MERANSCSSFTLQFSDAPYSRPASAKRASYLAVCSRACNDVGLLAEEFDPLTGRVLGNFPQAYSHVGLINSALNLSRQKGPAQTRPSRAIGDMSPIHPITAVMLQRHERQKRAKRRHNAVQ
jgi:hypothetical protein